MLLGSASSSSSSSQQQQQQQQQHQKQQRQSSSLDTSAEAEIKLAIHCSNNQLSVHVIEAKNLRSQSGQKCNSFVRIGFSPETGSCRSPKCQTGLAPKTDFPLFDQQFGVDLPASTGDNGCVRSLNLLISVWSQIQDGGFSEFLGSVTFPIDALIGTHRPSSWYKLANEMAGGRVGGLVGGRAASSASSGGGGGGGGGGDDGSNSGQSTAASAARGGGGLELKDVLIRRVPNRGLGFTVSGSCPAHVSKVERRSPADAAGVRAGDYILRVDGQRVSEADNEIVVRLLRNTGAAAVRLQLGRCCRVAKSPSLPLTYCQGQHQQQHQHQHQHQHQPSAIKRDIRSLYDIASNQSGSASTAAHTTASSVTSNYAHVVVGHQIHFVHRDQLMVRPSELLVHSGPLSLLADVKTGAVAELLRGFLFPDVLLLAQGSNSRQQLARDLQEVYELAREPIYIHQITHCLTTKGLPDLHIKYIGQDGSSRPLRLRCQTGERDCQTWCRRVQDRLLQTVIL